ncbi:MAG: iron-sulfur cluster repair di-iron protein [Phycisphaerae bacterium]|jgi:regulator of cell morphogenesis and NO signaling
MRSFDANATVGQLVAERPSRARVFERFEIDYCCGGKQPLAEACAERGLDPESVLAELRAADAAPHPSETDWTTAPLGDLCDHIVAAHHAYLRRELPRLEAMSEKVAEVHGRREPHLRELAAVFAALHEELDQHMAKEEQVLFPLVRLLESSTALPSFHCGSVANPIRVMEHEHDDAGAALTRMRRLTGGYAPPPEACNTYRALLDGLAELEADLHRHIHKENNILFPRAAALEARLAASCRLATG